MKDENKERNENLENSSLSPEEIQMINARMEQIGEDRSKIEPFDKSAPAQAVRYAKKHKTSTIILAIAALSVLLVIVLLIVYMVTKDHINKSDFKVIIGENTFSADYEDIVINKVVYIDMNKVAAINDITISGDKSSRKYTLPNLQYARFEADSDIAIVDGNYVLMDAAAISDDNMFLVPIEFMSKIVKSGLNFNVDKKENVIEITRVEVGKDKNDNIVYEPITFSTESLTTTNSAYEPFGIDISNILSAIDPKGNNDYLILVNHSNPLSRSYEPTDLVDLTCDINPANPRSYYSLRSDAEKALNAMMQAMKNNSVSGIQVSSSYRSYDRQKEILDLYIDSKMSTEGLSYEQAKKEVLKTLAEPGHSEHQTGLSVDFVQGTSSLTVDFENTMAFNWLSQNAHKFGFILRYPEDKVSITGYDYEPWHYRYVGRTVASRIYEAGLCYEEYVALTQQY